MDEEDSDDDFDFERFLLAEQVRKYYYHGFYPFGIFLLWTLLRAGCYDLSGCDSLGNPPIVYASKCGNIVLLKMLLHYKADINALSKLRETALIVACRNKRMRAIKLLLKRGAQTDLVDRTGYSALRWAVIHEHVDMVKLLLRYSASVTKDCYTAGSAFDIAKRGTSEQHAIILKELEKKLVTEREALLIEIAKQNKDGAIAEIEDYRKTHQAKKEEKQEKTEVKAQPSEPTVEATPKTSKRSTAKSRKRILASEMGMSVGARVPTPPVEQGGWLEDSSNDSSDWVKVADGKWQTCTHLQEAGTSVSTAATTMVEPFAPDRVTVRKLLTSDGKWQAFMHQQMAQLTIEDLE
ncbi:ankyrin repeat-containing protein [Phytophthora cinnamomi]|uniref:ankyrin repeat-containing protein n=1 Tax=Phytophthora cinnamomi TaxID=4785 RepID=UPI00355A66A7|nr:ankyrin repeat-containing protein [Phytophthora cinnamomi]